MGHDPLADALAHTCGYECFAVEELLERLTDDHGDGEPIEPTPQMLRAARVFVYRVIRQALAPVTPETEVEE